MPKIVTVAGLEKIEDVLARAPMTNIIVWATEANFFESKAFGPTYPFFSDIEVLMEGISVIDVWNLFFGGLGLDCHVDKTFHVCLSPAEVVEKLKSAGYKITEDILSSAVLKNTTRR